LISSVPVGTFGCRCQPWRGTHLADVKPALGDTIHKVPSSVSNNSSSIKLTSLQYHLNHVVSSQPPLSSVTPPSMTVSPVTLTPITLTTMTLLSPQHLGHMMNPSVMTGNEVVFGLHCGNVVCGNYISHAIISNDLIADLLRDLFCHEIPTKLDC